MIYIGLHNDKFIKKYEEKILKIITTSDFISIRKKRELLHKLNGIFPKRKNGKNWFDLSLRSRIKNTNNQIIQNLILLGYEEIKQIVDYIEENNIEFSVEDYKVFKSFYENLRTRQYDSKKMFIHFSKSLKLTVCPYCNRDYINSRGNSHAGFEMDHFFSKDKYPFFAISLYNLVPSCSSCNRLKSNKNINLSPYDETIDNMNSDVFTLGKDKEVEIIKNKVTNYEELNIADVYSIFSEEVSVFIDYSESMKEEIVNKLKINSLSEGISIDDLIHGIDYKEPDFKNKPLSKMKYDLMSSLGLIE